MHPLFSSILQNTRKIIHVRVAMRYGNFTQQFGYNSFQATYHDISQIMADSFYLVF